MALTPQQLEAIQRLRRDEKWSVRKIARHLHLCRKSIRRYLNSGLPKPVRRSPRVSKLDGFQEIIGELIERDPSASAVVIRQRLQSLGYTGELTILRDYLKSLRRRQRPLRAYVRVESPPGDCFQVDWGHFDALDYQGDRRKLYAFCLVECHSRRLYLEFTHSQSFEPFVRCHQHAFRFMGGVARQILFDNLVTAVAEHDGQIVRVNPRFLAFAREYHFYPRACHVAAPWEKGKVEKGGVGYVRQNFWPLRQFTDLADVNRQAREWLDQVANCRIHRETRQPPEQRFRPDALQPLPAADSDYRDTALALVHTDLRLCFDGNRYCVPARFVGQRLTVKADSGSVTLYHEQDEIVCYPRCWRRGQTLGAERFEKELLAQRPAAARSAAQQRLLALLGPAAETYLRHLAEGDRSLPRQINELLELARHYGPAAVTAALAQAQAARAFGADYIANILRQQHSPRPLEPPLKLKDPELNQLATDPLSLLDYDALILTPRRES
jgi:transposase